jgi:hypothetical protein
MRLRRRAMVSGIAAVAIVLGLAATTVAASAKDGGNEPDREGSLLTSTVIGRPASPTIAVPIRGVAPGAVAWAGRGNTRVTADGRFTFEIRGLLIVGTGTPLDGTTGPVKTVVAALTCDGTTPTIVSSAAVALSSHGNAKVNQKIALPTTCLAPIVLVLANGSSGPWIAASGF